jgi:hypothetical protein
MAMPKDVVIVSPVGILPMLFILTSRRSRLGSALDEKASERP